MNRKGLAILVAPAALILAGCHQHSEHHARQASAPAPGGSGSTQQVHSELASIPTHAENNAGGYTHTPFAHRGKCDTRALLLQQTGQQVRTNKNCTVTSGHWTDAYSGAPVTSPKAVDIDHMIPLAEAWRSGASRWSPRTWQEFVNDTTNGETVVANASLNRAKGDKTPDQWLPPSPHEVQCDYTARYIHTQAVWNQRTQSEGGLSMDPQEKAGIQRALDACPTTAGR